MKITYSTPWWYNGLMCQWEMDYAGIKAIAQPISGGCNAICIDKSVTITSRRKYKSITTAKIAARKMAVRWAS